MPQAIISAGETVELVTGQRGDAYTINTDGEIRIHSNRSFARQGRTIQPDDRAEAELRFDGEGIYAYAVEDATVEYARQGFSLSFFGREIIRIENSPNEPNVDINRARQSATSVVEVNADQTSTITNGGSTTSSVTANQGELWRVTGMFLNAPSYGSTFSQGSVLQRFEVVTSEQSVVMSIGETESTNADLTYQAGTWTDATTGSGFATVDGDVIGSLIDEDNGLTVEYTIADTSETQDNDREVRFQFEVTQI